MSTPVAMVPRRFREALTATRGLLAGVGAELLHALDSRPNGDIYRIAVCFIGADPRIELRESELDDDALSALRKRLARLDAKGPWTTDTPRLIADNPEVRAGDLATLVGRDRDSFKTDVRKLKNLGLTESLVVGYRISPRGQHYLASELVRLRRNGSAASPRESGSKNAPARRVGRRTAPDSD